MVCVNTAVEFYFCSSTSSSSHTRTDTLVEVLADMLSTIPCRPNTMVCLSLLQIEGICCWCWLDMHVKCNPCQGNYINRTTLASTAAIFAAWVPLCSGWCWRWAHARALGERGGAAKEEEKVAVCYKCAHNPTWALLLDLTAPFSSYAMNEPGRWQKWVQQQRQSTPPGNGRRRRECVDSRNGQMSMNAWKALKGKQFKSLSHALLSVVNMSPIRTQLFTCFLLQHGAVHSVFLPVRSFAVAVASHSVLIGLPLQYYGDLFGNLFQ